MKMILMMVLPVLAFIGGAVGGDLLHGNASKASEESKEGAEPPKSSGETAEARSEDSAEKVSEGADTEAADKSNAADWFHFPDQFFVPILRNGTTSAVMVLSLTLEMPSAARASVEAQEHRLRDALLNALMIQSNTGGFDGNFTSASSLDSLKSALLAAARKAGGSEITSVLIEDIAKQEQ